MTVRRAIVLADGDAGTRAELDGAWPGWADEVTLVVAADAGARYADALGLRVDAWVGDGDSADPSLLATLRRGGVDVRPVGAEKDESDTELAILAAIARGASDVTVLGALGGPRFDHALANVWLLAHPGLEGRTARLLDPTYRIRLVVGPGSIDLDGRVGGVVTLLPFDGPARGITTTGLRYPLHDEDLAAGPARGLSNVRAAAAAAVRLRVGRLLVVESAGTFPP